MESAGAPEEPALERAEELLADERLYVDRPTVALEHAHVVLEHVVRPLEGVVELVALEHVLVGPRLVRVAQLRVHRPAHRPDGALLALDPDDDVLLVPRVVDPDQCALGETILSRPAADFGNNTAPCSSSPASSGIRFRSSSPDRRRRSAWRRT